jgi:hypothetical protein
MTPDGRTDFDFITGHWQIANRKLEWPAPEEAPAWLEFPSTAISRPIIGGLGNIDEYHVPDLPGRGEYHGMALRLFEPGTDLWRIWWASHPGTGDLDPAVIGRFHEQEGLFEGEAHFEGRPIRVRFGWSDITPRSARWEQSFSFDGGASFAVNWVMRFQRAGSEAAGRLEQVVNPMTSPATNFDFMLGDWRVHNRRLEVPLTQARRPDRWVEFESRVSSRHILGGRGLVETYSFPDFPGRGEFDGFVLRLVDPRTEVWRVWWTSSGSDGLLDTPVVGGFVEGEGIFAGTDVYDQRPVLVRTRYSDITPTTVRWEQSFSFDDGRTYLTDWIMEFHRAG